MSLELVHNESKNDTELQAVKHEQCGHHLKLNHSRNSDTNIFMIKIYL